MKVKSARVLTVIILIVGMIITQLANLYEPFRTIGVIVVLSCLIPAFLYNRCPYCKKYLGKSDGDFCPYCGKEIE